ncbi:uncharacterized protein L199_008284 [Kwoniella botswanensis]|uniref:uncharacterized protein n=1 Tax=Kwoniella botswanensis TaxID=1268659 RepID=UPI00315C7148
MSTGNTTCKGESMTWAVNDRGETPSIPTAAAALALPSPCFRLVCLQRLMLRSFRGVASLPRTQNFSSWLDGCENPQIGSLPDNVARSRSVSIPQWASVSPRKSDEAWNITLALANATSLQPSFRTSSNVTSTISSASITTSMDSLPQPVQTYSEVGEVMNGARKGGQTTGAVVGALGGTVLISIILVYLYKQKR